MTISSESGQPAVTPFSTPIHPVQLEGFGVILQPMRLAHAEGLKNAASDGELWNLVYTSAPEPGQETAYIETALKGQQDGHMLPFTVLDAKTKKVIGTTRYHDIVTDIARLEIGYTWYAKSWQRTHVNTACKYLLLFYAFQSLQANVVGWRTDIINQTSQKAIERLGAKKDGVLRGHAKRRDGSIRDTVMYSVTREEWPAIKKSLQEKLAAFNKNTPV
ncbi:GNAT family N-acetyltransferase [Advenella sp. WQ 585]|uniref:GNAT family N-acetyltransferase n=1 Tax=Advenella mandrilli TaxID=2800330 RepID=A0ABS1EAI7_9BURK|nr:GNAT family protein [Advenella mandrilli]MBK1779908.1 GNAT family N-acetyltransferase [Advenella mandrilli]